MTAEECTARKHSNNALAHTFSMRKVVSSHTRINARTHVHVRAGTHQKSHGGPLRLQMPMHFLGADGVFRRRIATEEQSRL
jgi:hypothetical protein